MTASNSTAGFGRGLPAQGNYNQVPAIRPDVSTGNEDHDVAWSDNGARIVTALKTSAYTTTYGEIVACDTTSAGFNVTLPSPKTGPAAPITVFREAGSNNVTVVGTINGGSNTTVAGTAKTFVPLADGSAWYAY